MKACYVFDVMFLLSLWICLILMLCLFFYIFQKHSFPNSGSAVVSK